MKKMPGVAPNGAGKLFFLFMLRLTQTLPTFWAGQIWTFDNLYLFVIFGIPNFCISRFPDFQNLVQAKLGPGWAGLEPSGTKHVDFLL